MLPREAPVDGLESIAGKLALLWNVDQPVPTGGPYLALRTVLDFLAGQTGWDPLGVI